MRQVVQIKISAEKKNLCALKRKMISAAKWKGKR
jgi:hypothetical protein